MQYVIKLITYLLLSHVRQFLTDHHLTRYSKLDEWSLWFQFFSCFVQITMACLEDEFRGVCLFSFLPDPTGYNSHSCGSDQPKTFLLLESDSYRFQQYLQCTSSTRLHCYNSRIALALTQLGIHTIGSHSVHRLQNSQLQLQCLSLTLIFPRYQL